MSATLNPYLTFNGNAAETMKFHHSILGGKLNMQTFDEAKVAKTPAEKDRIIHATLETDSITLMASDGMINQSVKFGDNVSLRISGQDKDKLARIFDRLANCGMVNMALAKQFWGDTFGMLTDKFGVHWMVNSTSQVQEQRSPRIQVGVRRKGADQNYEWAC